MLINGTLLCYQMTVVLCVVRCARRADGTTGGQGRDARVVRADVGAAQGRRWRPHQQLRRREEGQDVRQMDARHQVLQR